MHFEIDPDHKLTNEDLQNIALLEQQECNAIRKIQAEGRSVESTLEEASVISAYYPTGFSLDMYPAIANLP